MIISKTPYRISFFGGGSDYPEWYNEFGHGEVISATINKYIYISCRELPNFFNHKYRIVYSKVEEVNNINNIKHIVIRNALKTYNIRDNLEIHYDGDLPSRSGVGSSSSFIVGLLNIINTIQNKKKNKIELANQSIMFEQKILKEYVGSQDQAACAIGGINNIIFKEGGKITLKKIENQNFFKKLNKNLVLLFTKQQRYSSAIAKKFIKNLTKNKKNEINEILECVKIAKKIIKKNQLNEFARLLDYSWKIKKNLHQSISNKNLDEIYDLAIKNGALGGKILGAGGGGFYLFYVEQEKQKRFFKNMKKFTIIPFEFENQGSEIIFNK